MKTDTIINNFGSMRADYDAAKSSRFRRQRNGLGGNGDAHYANPRQFWEVREYARDMDRNDGVVGQAISRACDNILQGGLKLNPDTGDKSLDSELREMWRDWTRMPIHCDAKGTFSFQAIERISLRHSFLDGDCFVLPLDNGSLQVVEGHRCLTPDNTKRNVVHGVLIDSVGKPVQYWFTKTDTDQYQRIERVGDMQPYDVFDSDGERSVMHTYDPRRYSQTRGITALHPVFKMAGMLEDLNMAKLIQAQVVSCIAAFVQSDGKAGFGTKRSETGTDGSTRTLEKLYPGMVKNLAPGETIAGFSPNVPNAEFFEQVKLILRIIGANLGLPLTLVLLDTSNTTFHGYRGELDQAHIGFRRIQQEFPLQFHMPIYRWKVRSWLPKLGAAALKLFRDGRLYRHSWMGEAWPYVDPLKDANADLISMENMLESPRRIHARRGRDFDDVLREAIDDNKNLIRSAQAAAIELNTELGLVLTWRDLVNPRGDKLPALAPPGNTQSNSRDSNPQKDSADPEKDPEQTDDEDLDPEDPID